MTLDPLRDGYVVSFFAIPGVTASGVLPDPLILPCVVNDIEVQESADHNDYTTVAIGDFSQPSGGRFARKLQTTSLDVLCTSYQMPFAPGEFGSHPDPLRIEAQLRSVMRRRTPVQFFVDDRSPLSAPSSAAAIAAAAEFQMSSATGGGCTFRSLSRTRRAGNPGALWLTVEITEWRNPDANLTVSTQAFNGRSLPTTYKTKAGDSLRSIALDFYGSYSYWTTIAKANHLRSQFQSIPLAPGTTLKIPVRPAKASAPKSSSSHPKGRG